jgi:hypothetical protein
MKRSIKNQSVTIFTLILMAQALTAQDEILFRKHVVYSGINGLFYGIALDVISEANGGAAFGIPVISAGVSALIPLMTNSSKTISSNSLVLSGHGKFVGWAHGFALATLAGGENAWNGDNYKLTIGLGAAASIGLGILGNSLGKNEDWTEGQVALYRHYGWIVPLSGTLIMASFVDEPRLYGGAVLLCGAGGYLLADKIYSHHEYTRGDIRATQVLTLLNGGLGYGIVEDRMDRGNLSRSDFLIPAIGILSGTIAGQMWLKDVNLTQKQGLQTAYAATGGAILGLGIALLTESEHATPYYIIPYITGLGAYAIAVESFRKKNALQVFLPHNHSNRWEVAFMPQNLFLNSRIPEKGYLVNGRLTGMQPVFAASLSF